MNLREFLEFHLPALEADEVRNYMLLDILAGVVKAPSREFRGWTFGGAGACAVQPVSDWAIVLGDLAEHECVTLAEEVHASEFTGVIGTDERPVWFADRAKALGVVFHEALRNRIHRLDTVPQAPTVDGVARTVTPKDAALFAGWMNAYTREALPRDAMPEPEWLERWAAEGNYLFWTVNGEPVSVAGIVCRTRNGSAITGVYTPPEHRGRGYAGAVTSAAAQRIFDEGRKSVFLMANVNNPAAERCYEKIGFRPIADFTYFYRKIA